MMISVIVPVYKVEEFLPHCIESIIKQTYAELELILVDDGSPDGCGKICDEYATIDERIVVIHKENGGLSDSRNAGLEIAKGDYVTFVDGDDYIALNMLECFKDKVDKYDADIVQCEFFRTYKDVDVSVVDRPEREVVLTGLEAMEDYFVAKKHIITVATGKLYKISLFKENDIIFPKEKLHEDNFINYKLFYYANKVVCSNLQLYFYYQRSESIMKRKFDTKRLDIVEAAEQAVEFVESNNIPLLKQVMHYYVYIHKRTIEWILLDSGRREWKSLLNRLRRKIIESGFDNSFNKSIPLNRRLSLLTLWMGYWAYFPFMYIWWSISGQMKGKK